MRAWTCALLLLTAPAWADDAPTTTLRIAGPPNVRITIDGKHGGTTTRRLKGHLIEGLKRGRHTVRFERRTFLPVERSVDLTRPLEFLQVPWLRPGVRLPKRGATGVLRLWIKPTVATIRVPALNVTGVTRNGEWRLEGLAADRVIEIVVRAGKGRMRIPVFVLPGGKTSVHLEPERNSWTVRTKTSSGSDLSLKTLKAPVDLTAEGGWKTDGVTVEPKGLSIAAVGSATLDLTRLKGSGARLAGVLSSPAADVELTLDGPVPTHLKLTRSAAWLTQTLPGGGSRRLPVHLPKTGATHWTLMVLGSSIRATLKDGGRAELPWKGPYTGLQLRARGRVTLSSLTLTPGTPTWSHADCGGPDWPWQPPGLRDRLEPIYRAIVRSDKAGKTPDPEQLLEVAWLRWLFPERVGGGSPGPGSFVTRLVTKVAPEYSRRLLERLQQASTLGEALSAIDGAHRCSWVLGQSYRTRPTGKQILPTLNRAYALFLKRLPQLRSAR